MHAAASLTEGASVLRRCCRLAVSRQHSVLASRRISISPNRHAISRLDCSAQKLHASMFSQKPKWKKSAPETNKRLMNAMILDAGVSSIRVIASSGEQLGILPTGEALERSKGEGLDLVMVSPDAKPPVCRIMVPKEPPKRQEEERQKENTKKSKQVATLKDMRLSETIGDHDLQIKAKKVREFLTKDCTVRIFMNNFKESAKAAAVLEKLATDLADVGSIRDKPRIKGRRITLILGPSTS